MSRNIRRYQRRAVSVKRTHQKTWLRRYLRALQGGVAAASISAMTMFAQPAQAANDTWIGNTSANWADAANWSSLPVTGDSLVFGAAGTAGTTLTDNLTTGSGTFTIAGITFNAGAPSYLIAPASGKNTFALTGGITNSGTNLETFNDNILLSGVSTITLTAGGGNLALGGVLSGVGGVATAGTGTLTLTRNNSYSWGTTMNARATLNIK